MRRTQIYLDNKIIKLLDKLASKTGKTRSELIRESLTQTYTQSDVNQTIKKLAGLQSFADFELTEAMTKFKQQRKW